MTNRVISLLRNRTFIMVSAFAGGLIFSDLAKYTSSATFPALLIALTVSITQISIADFIPVSKTIKPIVAGVFFNYFVLGSLILLLAWWLIPEPDLWAGYVLVAAGPPGVVVIPFTYILKGDTRLTLVGLYGAFFLSIIITPIMVSVFIGGSSVPTSRLVYAMTQYILIPLVLSRVLCFLKINSYIEKYKGTIINWCFFVVIFSVVGLNRALFLSEPNLLIRVIIIAFMSTFFLAYFVDYMGKKLSIAHPERQSYILLATIKTAAFSSTLALALFNEIASFPGAVVAAFYTIYFIYLGIKGDRMQSISGTPE
ncbi:MAG: hypothetical protein SCJ97_03915 [Bacillota bacterium]|nr:hypothetical protein [Bacillota bacterium]